MFALRPYHPSVRRVYQPAAPLRNDAAHDRPADRRAALVEGFSHDGPVLIDFVSARQELIVPSKTTLGEAESFGLFMLKAALNGRGTELMDLAKVNLLR